MEIEKEMKSIDVCLTLLRQQLVVNGVNQDVLLLCLVFYKATLFVTLCSLCTSTTPPPALSMQ